MAAVELDGSNDYISLGNDGNTAASVNYLTNYGTSSFTIEGWFWADTVTTDNTSIFRQGSQNAFPQVVVQLKTGPKLAASVETSTPGHRSIRVPPGSPPSRSIMASLRAGRVRDLVTRPTSG